MSGHGGSDDSWRKVIPPTAKTPNQTGKGGGGQGAIPDPCDIDEITVINSPDRSVLATLRVGDSLIVELLSGPPRRLIVKSASGAVVGSITSASLPQLVKCSQNGVQYYAEVLGIRGAVCQVRVHRQ